MLTRTTERYFPPCGSIFFRRGRPVRTLASIFGVIAVLALSQFGCAGRAFAHAAAPVADTALQPVIVEATAMPGAAVDVNQIPGNVQVLSAADLTQSGSANLTGALDAGISSVNINDNLDDPFQPDILYRGFEASPVLGTAQGLAVYQNGVRINEAFGDTVNWDLFPDNAINQVELVSANPLYGLNALGGAIALTMKNAFTYRGGDLGVTAGSYGRRDLTAQYGGRDGKFGVYLAGKAADSSGWRRFSSDRIRDFYAVLSAHSTRGSVDLSFTSAGNTMNGQGAVPVQELAVNRSLVFTGPQTNRDTLRFFVLNSSFRASHALSLQGVFYYRDFGETVANGNSTSYQACAGAIGILCQPDGVTPLTNAQGQPLADISAGGTRLIGENDFERLHTWGRGGTLQATLRKAVFGRENRFTVGAALDYAATSFYSGAQIGLMDSQLQVLPSSLIVDTAENSAGALANGDPVPVNVDSINKNLGVYLTDRIRLTHRLAVTASGRYNIAYVDLADQLGTNLNGRNRYVHFNPALGATYALRPSITLYGDLSENTRTPTASEIECSDPSRPCVLPSSLAGDPPNLRQVVAHSGELGLRGHFTGTFLAGAEFDWNLSLFRTLLKDDIHSVATSLSQGFFENIGDTRRQGLEAGVHWRIDRWSGYTQYSFVQATFMSPLLVPSPSNPYRNAQGDILVRPGDRLPGIPENRLKLGAQYRAAAGWRIGAAANYTGSFYYVGDESNQLPAVPGFVVVDLHTSYRPMPHLKLFLSVDNLFDRQYATWGTLGDPTGVGAPGVPTGGGGNGSGVDNRFLSPSAPTEAYGGFRLSF